MFFLLFILFTTIPVLELMMLFRVGAVIGPLPTLAIVILTGIVGAALARSQGRQIFFEIQKKLERGETPEYQMFAGVLVFAGGLLLLTPGFMTDFLGLAMIFPITRYFIIRFLQNRIADAIKSGNIQYKVYNHQSSGTPRASRPTRDVNTGGRVIDVKRLD